MSDDACTTAGDAGRGTDEYESLGGLARDPDRDPDSPLIDVRNVSVAYGDVDVLSAVSLAVDRGELVGLVGPNGAGKTTLLQAINGVLAPDAGRVAVAGDDVHALSSRAASRRVATVPQDTTVAFEFAVEDVVAMGRTPYHGRLSGDPDAAGAVDRALDRTRTERFRDRPVSSLSGGERQRVVIARALAQETPALVLDEPTASLDVNHQVRTLELVRELTRSADKAALAAIHDLDLAARFCDRIAVLSGGAVVAAGPPADVLTGDTVESAFDTAAAVLPNPVTGTPTVTPLSGTATGSAASGSSATGRSSGGPPTPGPDASPPAVHVVGGGRLAARTIATFVRSGATVTAGPLVPGDLATETAAELDVETVTAPPFEPLDAAPARATRAHLDDAAVAVVAGPVPASVRDLVRDHDPDAVVRVVDGSDACDDHQTEDLPEGGTLREAEDPPGAGDRRETAAEATAVGTAVSTDVSTVVSVAGRVASGRVETDD